MGCPRVSLTSLKRSRSRQNTAPPTLDWCGARPHSIVRGKASDWAGRSKDRVLPSALFEPELFAIRDVFYGGDPAATLHWTIDHT